MKLIEIFEGNLFQAQMVKNLLENEGIESFLKDEIIARSPIFRPAGGVRVMISVCSRPRGNRFGDRTTGSGP